jgi:serine protease
MRFQMLSIALIGCLLWAPVLAQKAQTVEGELLVQLREGVEGATIENSIEQESGILPGFRMVRCISAPMRIWLASFNHLTVTPREMLRLLSVTPGVSSAQVNHIVTERETVPDDPFFGNQWHHQESGDHDIDSELAWDITTGGQTPFGEDIVACIIETQGAKWDQTDIIDNHWVNIHEIPNNDEDDDANGYLDDYDGWNGTSNTDNLNQGNHGTQVSSMIGAKGNNGIGITGVNWDVKLMVVQMGGVSEANAIEAYTYPLVMRKLYNETNGDRGAFVVVTNSSWGTDFGQAASAPLWCAMYDSLGYYGVLSCGATTNNNVNVDEQGDLPTSCPSNYLISVTATNNQDVRNFSGYGTTNVDLAAPGENVHLATNSGYGNASGTSFSTPCTAGAVALMYSAPCNSLNSIALADPALAASMVRDYILDGADPISGLADECVTGGRLNVNESLNLLLEDCSSGDCVAPFSLEASQVGQSMNYEIGWGSIPEMSSYAMRFRIEGTPDWTLTENITAPPVSLDNLLLCTSYEVQVMASCTEGQSDWSESYIFLTTGCCENPAAGSMISAGGTWASVSWNPVFGVDVYDLVITGAGIDISAEDIALYDHTFYDLIPCEDYIVSVTSQCPEGPAPGALVIPVSSGGCESCTELTFCQVSGDSDAEWISQVTIGPFTNDSGPDDGYGDYTGLIAELTAGETYPISCTPDFSGFSYSEYFLVWLDLNANGLFEDTELVFDPGAANTSTVSGSISIPQWVADGHLRMRVAMSYYGSFGGGDLPVECGTIDYGEAEDYCIRVINNVHVSTQETTDLIIYPNPSRGQVRLSIPFSGQLIVHELTGRVVRSELVRREESIQLDNLSPGIYVIRLHREDGMLSTGKLIVH